MPVIEDRFGIIHTTSLEEYRAILFVVRSRDDVPSILEGEDVRPDGYLSWVRVGKVDENCIYIWQSELYFAEAKWDPARDPSVSIGYLLRRREINTERAYMIEV